MNRPPFRAGTASTITTPAGTMFSAGHLHKAGLLLNVAVFVPAGIVCKDLDGIAGAVIGSVNFNVLSALTRIC